MTEGAHGQHRADQVEVEDCHLHRRIGQHVVEAGDALLEQRGGGLPVGGTGQLGLELDAAERVGRVVEDVVGKDLVVAHQGQHVVRGGDGGGEQADLGDRAGHPAGADEVADLERAQDDDEAAGGQIGQQPRPGHADGQADRGDQRGEGGGLHAEITEDADHQQDVEGDGDERAEVAQHGRVDPLVAEGLLHQADGDADQPATDHPEGDGGENLHGEGRAIVGDQLPQLAGLFGTGTDQIVFVHGGSPARRADSGNASTCPENRYASSVAGTAHAASAAAKPPCPQRIPLTRPAPAPLPAASPSR
ncbi:hypothetical protein D3C78_1139300 [compost metagenome]